MGRRVGSRLQGVRLQEHRLEAVQIEPVHLVRHLEHAQLLEVEVVLQPRLQPQNMKGNGEGEGMGGRENNRDCFSVSSQTERRRMGGIRSQSRERLDCIIEHATARAVHAKAQPGAAQGECRVARAT